MSFKKSRIINKATLTRGSSLMEFAIIAPILLILIAGIIQFGFIMNAKIAVNAASFEGARAAILSENPEEDAINAVYHYANSSLPGWSFDERLKADIDIDGYNPGDNVLVAVYYEVPVFFQSLLPAGDSSFFKVESESLMRIEEKR
ncbi:MAG: TadE/TadG family type IV pilus assembly protein [Actinomycetota bacterium]|jgi:hypothetical protein|nr:TadE/TadG family type IV pilus assembly protein [Actinomycetota bacterium]